MQYLEQNPSLVALLKEQKASLINVTDVEQVAILEAFDTEVSGDSGIWA